MNEEVKLSLVNPINGERVDESITETEAKKRGYFDFQFILKHLEDDNEYIKYFILEDGKKVLVNLNRPKYNKPSEVNHLRILETNFDGGERKMESQLSNPLSCVMGEDASCCQACGS